MLVKTEIIGLLIGLVAVVVELIILFNWSSFPQCFRKYFYGGEFCAVAVGLALIVGFLSSIIYLVNLMRKKWDMWWLRLIGFLALYLGFAIIGASGI